VNVDPSLWGSYAGTFADWEGEGVTLPKPYYERDGITLYWGDCRRILPLLDLVDFCFDDPPYVGADWSGLFPLLRVAAQRLVVTPGASNLATWLRQADPAWTYCWISNADSRGGAACMNIGWEPVVAFDLPLRPLGTDVLRYPIGTQVGVGDHPHPKPLGLITKIVAHWTREGEVILDPHLGSGTTALAAKTLGRGCIGIEQEKRYLETTVKRLAQEVMPL